MTVRNGQVTMGEFNGYVDPNGYVSMVVGSRVGGIYLSGTFHDAHFEGQVRNPQPGCNYRLEMNRVS
jgi:hypothetical protein